MRHRQRPPKPPEPAKSPISEAHRRFVQVVFYIHLTSLVACAAASGLQARDAVAPAHPSDQQQQKQLPQHSHHITVPPWVTGSRQPSTSFKPNMSYFWQENESPDNICRLSGSVRIAYLNSTYLFHERHPISVWEVFMGGTGRESRLRLREGIEGLDCVHGSENRCLKCFNRVKSSLRRLNSAYGVFNKTLHRFDCMPAIDTASATRPFSPNGSCEHCKTWYGRWLLVHLLDVWEQPPCINWCFYAQLACPHLATSKVVDYAGHPSFQCRDLHIPIGDADTYSCNCVHPCDVRGAVSIKSGSGSGSTTGNDFFAAKHHCAMRRRQCGNTAHDRQKSSGSASVGNTAVSWRTPSATFLGLGLPATVLLTVLVAAAAELGS